MSHSYPQYNSNLNQTIRLELSEGLYSIEVRATNLYGISGKANLESVQISLVPLSFTSTSTMSIAQATYTVSSITMATISSPVTMTSVPSATVFSVSSVTMATIPSPVTMTSVPSPTVFSTSTPTDDTKGC